MRNYVNPNWDETFNRSYFAKGTWKKTAVIIKADYCSLKESQKVVDRMTYYQARVTASFSLNYINELKAEGYKRAPVPEVEQSIDELCQDLILAKI